jgi:hypothetical protein
VTLDYSRAFVLDTDTVLKLAERSIQLHGPELPVEVRHFLTGNHSHVLVTTRRQLAGLPLALLLVIARFRLEGTVTEPGPVDRPVTSARIRDVAYAAEVMVGLDERVLIETNFGPVIPAFIDDAGELAIMAEQRAHEIIVANEARDN